MTSATTITKADNACAKGELWRAKEILQGRVASHPFDPVLYEALGNIYLKMGDLFEAGRFLFVSGSRETQYQRAIDVWLNRFAKASAEQFHSNLPSRARSIPISELPSAVENEFTSRGFKKRDLHLLPTSAKSSGLMSKFSVIFSMVLLFGALGLFVLGVATGVKTAIGWIW